MARSDEVEGYSSPLMRARRARILEETRKMIAEDGVAGFSLLELCRRADVAKRTLYYTYENKEGLIAAAILDYFEEYEQAIPYHSPPGSLERLLERLVAVGRRNLTIRNYVAAIIAVYYAQGSSPQIWNALHGVTAQTHRAWIEKLAAARQLQPWIEAATLIDDLVAQRYAVSNEWIQGRIPDDQMISRQALSELTYLLGATRGAARRQVEEALRQVQAMGVEAYVESLPWAPRDDSDQVADGDDNA